MKTAPAVILLSMLAGGIAVQTVAQPADPPAAPELTLSVNGESRLTISPGTPLVFEVLFRNGAMARATEGVASRADLEQELAGQVRAGTISQKEADNLLAREPAPAAVGPMTIALDAGSLALVTSRPEGDQPVPWGPQLVEPATATTIILDDTRMAYAVLVVTPEQAAGTAAGTYRLAVAFEGKPAEGTGWEGKALSDAVEVTVAVESATPTAEDQKHKQLAFVQYHLAMKHYDHALEAGRQALTVAPESVDALILLGRAHEGKRDFQAALETYQKALDAFYRRHPESGEPPVGLMANVRRMRDQLGIKLPEAAKFSGPRQGAVPAPAAATVPAAPAATPLNTAAPLGTSPMTTAASSGRSFNSLDVSAQCQWPVQAKASSQYGTTSYSAQQALGSPNTHGYGDARTAWAPAAENGDTEWLELTYPFSVAPKMIQVYESSGAGAIAKVMVRPEGDQAEWVTVLERAAPGGHVGETKPVVTAVNASQVARPVRVVRIEINTAVPGWNEIDAVALRGAYAVGTGEGQSTGAYRWWAESATASTEFSSPANSAAQVLGRPDTLAKGDHPTAWAPKIRDGGIEWLEVSFPRALAATELRIYESCGAGFVTKLEAWDDQAAHWTTVWEGQDSTDTAGVFTPPLSDLPAAVRTFRIHVNTAVPDWNEIDAVELVGN